MAGCKLIYTGDGASKPGRHEVDLLSLTSFLSSHKDPDALAEIFSKRSNTYLKLRRVEEALNDAQECIRLKPHWSEGYLRMGKAYEAKRKWKEACNVYKNGIKRCNYINKTDDSLVESLFIANKECNSVDFNSLNSLAFIGECFCIFCGERNCEISCPQCSGVYYCCTDHQLKDQPKHEKVCSEFGDARVHRDLLHTASNAITPRQVVPFKSIDDVIDWESVWKNFEFETDSDRQRLSLSYPLSFPLTLVAAICKFELHKRNKLLIHVLTGDANELECESYFKELAHFPLPDTAIYFIGPEMLYDFNVQQLVTAGRKKLTFSFIKDDYCNFAVQPECSLPDLAMAYHPSIMNGENNWLPALQYIATKSIPCVLTSLSESDFERDLAMLSYVPANIVFKGFAPFPSSVKTKYSERSWNHPFVGICNKYWIGFKGITGEI